MKSHARSDRGRTGFESLIVASINFAFGFTFDAATEGIDRAGVSHFVSIEFRVLRAVVVGLRRLSSIQFFDDTSAGNSRHNGWIQIELISCATSVIPYRNLKITACVRGGAGERLSSGQPRGARTFGHRHGRPGGPGLR